MVLEKQHISLDDLLAMDEDARVEIINWEMVKMAAAGGVHQIIAANILRILDRYVVEKKLGVILPDGMTYLMNSISFGLKDSFVPDVSYISHENVPEKWAVEKPHPGAPDLAVEIISPGDDAEMVQSKVRSYLEQGTQQIWLVYPKTKEVHQFTKEKPEQSRIYHGSTSIDAEALFPKIEGLTTDVIFDLPVWAIKDKE
jgi:Uma2 family endonuclease